MSDSHDFSEINETNAPRTLGELRELTENRPISQEQFKGFLDLASKREEREKTNPPAPRHDEEMAKLEANVKAQPETEPCINCGTPVDKDIHKEELGYCVDCSHKYYNHYPVVGSPHYDDDGCHECGVCHKHVGPVLGMSGEYREPEDHDCFE